jgi:hypothetical protein
MRRSVGRLTAAIAIAGIGLVACSDDKPALTQEEFVTQGNAICAAGNTRIEAIFSGLGDAPSEDDLAEAAGQLADDVEGQVGELRALTPPADLADDVDAALDSADSDLAALRDAGAAALSGAENPFTATNALLTGIGLTECGSNG